MIVCYEYSYLTHLSCPSKRSSTVMAVPLPRLAFDFQCAAQHSRPLRDSYQSEARAL